MHFLSRFHRITENMSCFLQQAEEGRGPWRPAGRVQTQLRRVLLHHFRLMCYRLSALCFSPL